MRDVAELVGENLRLADLRVDIAMRVTIDPIVDIRIRDIIAQLYRESTIDCASSKFLCCTLLRRHMVRENDLRFCCTHLYSLADEVETTFVFGIKIVRSETMSIV